MYTTCAYNHDFISAAILKLNKEITVKGNIAVEYEDTLETGRRYVKRKINGTDARDIKK